MKKKNTNDLQSELTAAPNLSRFLSMNQEQFVNENFVDMLQALFQKSGLSKAALAKRAGTSEVYLYQILSGMRTPSRDRTICLCFGLPATLEQTQELLKRSGFAQLYARNRRDAIIMYGLIHGMELLEVNDRLFAENEATLC
ncbi:MAG: helix-turn-helix transcriptional regulator [Candidatus Faecousia sp.]|nr:helix-turn-helix transcriptional regulator [Candidatus Faecousia sp.]